MADGSKTLFTVSLVLVLLVFVLTIFFNYLAGQDACCLHLGIFHSNTGNVSDKYNLEITPAGWAFSIWGVIYIYQAAWIVYSLTLLCRNNPATGDKLCISPAFMSPLTFLVLIVNFGLNVGWLFLWDREELWWGVLVLFLIAFTLYIAIGTSMYQLNKQANIMIDDGIGREIKLVIGLVHNGLGMYATWTTVATLLNLGSAMVYFTPNLEQQTSCSLALGILTLEIVLWVVLDNIVLEKYTRYLFTPYLVLIWALSASVSKNFDSSNAVSVFTAALLVIAVVVFVVKILLVVARRGRPGYSRGTGEHQKLTFKPTTQYS